MGWVIHREILTPPFAMRDTCCPQPVERQQSTTCPTQSLPTKRQLPFLPLPAP